MTLEILLAALLLYLAVRALARLILPGEKNARTLLVVEIILLVLGIIWLIVYGQIPPIPTWLA